MLTCVFVPISMPELLKPRKITIVLVSSSYLTTRIAVGSSLFTYTPSIGTLSGLMIVSCPVFTFMNVPVSMVVTETSGICRPGSPAPGAGREFRSSGVVSRYAAAGLAFAACSVGGKLTLGEIIICCVVKLRVT